MPIYGPKFRNLGGQKKRWTFLTSQTSALFGPANSQLVTYLKIQTKVCRVPSDTPMDWFLMKSVNAEYPLSCCKCVEKRTLCTRSPARPPKCVAPPPKMVPPYSPGSCPSKTPRTLQSPIAPSSRKNLIFWRHPILTKVLKQPWSHQKLTYVKIDQKGS